MVGALIHGTKRVACNGQGCFMDAARMQNFDKKRRSLKADCAQLRAANALAKVCAELAIAEVPQLSRQLLAETASDIFSEDKPHPAKGKSSSVV